MLGLRFKADIDTKSAEESISAMASRLNKVWTDSSKGFFSKSEMERIKKDFTELGEKIGTDPAKGLTNAFRTAEAGARAIVVAQNNIALGVGKAAENQKQMAAATLLVKAAINDIANIYEVLDDKGKHVTANNVQAALETRRWVDTLDQADKKVASISDKFLALRGFSDALKDVFTGGAIGAAGQSVMSSIGDEMALTAQIGRGGVSRLLQGATGINQGQSYFANRYNVNGGLALGNLLNQQHASVDTIMKSANAGGLGIQAGISSESEMAQLMMSLSSFGPEMSASDRMTILAQIQAASKAGGATTGATTTALTSFLTGNAGFISGMGAATGATSLMAAASGTGAGPQFASLISGLLTESRKHPEGSQARALQLLFGKSAGDINKMAMSGNYTGLRLNSNFLGDMAKGGEGSEALQAKLNALGLSSNDISMALPAFNAAMSKTESLRISPGDAQQQLLNSLSESRDAFTNLTESLKSLVTQSDGLRNTFLGVYSVGGMIAGLGSSIASVVTLFASMKTLGVLGGATEAAGGAGGLGGMAALMGAAAPIALTTIAGLLVAGGGFMLGRAIWGWFGAEVSESATTEDKATLRESEAGAQNMAIKAAVSKHIAAEALRLANPDFASHDDDWLINRQKEFQSGAMTNDPAKNISGISRNQWHKPDSSAQAHVANRTAVNTTFHTAISKHIASFTPA